MAAVLPVVSSTPTRWALERQVRLGAGVLVLIGSLLALAVHPLWSLVTLFVGAGLTFAGVTNVCGMALVLQRMPWNTARAAPTAGRRGAAAPGG